MTLTPVVITTPVSPPDGSTATDASYTITSSNLALLSNSAASSLLSVTNIGSAITSRINSTLELVESLQGFTAYLLDGTQLDGLANGATSAAFSVASVGSSKFVRIVLILNQVSPTGTPKVSISDGTTAYELSVSTSTAKKRIEFNLIPAAFVNSFTVTNNLGVSLPLYGNSVVVIPL